MGPLDVSQTRCSHGVPWGAYCPSCPPVTATLGAAGPDVYLLGGWQCPGCGACWSPQVLRCPACPQERPVDEDSPGEGFAPLEQVALPALGADDGERGAPWLERQDDGGVCKRRECDH